MRSFGPYVRQRFRFGARDRLSLIISSLSFQSVPGRELKYVMSWPANTLTPPYSALLRPTVVVGNEQLVVAASGEAVEKALNCWARMATGGGFHSCLENAARQDDLSEARRSAVGDSSAACEFAGCDSTDQRRDRAQGAPGRERLAKTSIFGSILKQFPVWTR